MAKGTSGLRPTWQLLAAAVLLMAWGVGAIRVTYEIEWTSSAVTSWLMMLGGVLLQWARPFPVPLGAQIG